MRGFTHRKTINMVIEAGEEGIPVHLLRLLKEALPSWKSAALDVSDISVRATSGNLTNRIWIVTADDGKIDDKEQQVVLVRIFGEGTSEYISRDKELALMDALITSSFNTCECLGFFLNGRIEKYIHGRDLKPEDFTDPIVGPVIARNMGTTLGKLHSLKTDFPYRDESIISKAMQFLSLAENIAFPSELDKTKRDQLRELNLPSMKAAFFKTHAEIMTMLCKSCQDSAIAAAVGLALIHGDLLCGNIMVDATSPLSELREGGNNADRGSSSSGSRNSGNQEGEELKLWLIDLEYSGMGCPAYDLGNHFNEYAGYEVDMALFPSREMRELLYRFYFKARKDVVVPHDEQVEEKAFYDTFDDCVMLFSLLSHLYWGMWAITLSSKDPAPMDYLDYARLRFNAYLYMVEKKGRI